RESPAGRSVTFRLGARRLGCDSIQRPRFDPDLHRFRPWCGFAVGRTRGGRLLDPRLDLCTATTGRTTAFAWIEPLPDARWIVVRDGRRRELYRTAEKLPIRVTTTGDVFPERSLALFHVTQYATGGGRLQSSTIVAVVAG